MSIHDKAHELAKELKNSEEYRSFLAAQKQLDTDEDAKRMIKTFLAKKLEAEYEMMAGKPEDKGKLEQLQKMYDLLTVNSRARDYIHAHMRFQQIMGDVYKIVGDSVAEGMSFFANE